MIRKSVTALLLLALLLGVFVLRQQDRSGPLTRTRLLMGTVVEITIHDRNIANLDEAVNTAFREMSAIESLMSPHLPESEINRIAAADGPVTVSPATLEVLRLAADISSRSDGAFDVTIGRLIRLWGFADGEPHVPTAEAIGDALAGSGYTSLLIRGDMAETRGKGILLDLGGVAKGYAIDRAAGALARAGISHASINAGGDIRLIGDRNGTPWRIGIQHPRRKGALLARLNLVDKAIVTSGDYERFFMRHGVRYHHILDPRTGYPAAKCQAVTITADRAVLADAVATAVFVLGPDKGMQLIEQMPEVEGLVVAADGSAEISAGLREVVEWQ